MEPQRRRRLVVAVPEVGNAQAEVRKSAELVDQCALPRKALGNVAGRWKPPCLRVPITFRVRVAAVHMDDHRNWPRVLPSKFWIGHVGRTAIDRLVERWIAHQPPRVRPMKGLVDRNDVLDEVAIWSPGPPPLALPRILHKVIDPIDRGGFEAGVLHGVGRVIELRVSCRCKAERTVERRGIGFGIRCRSISENLGGAEGVVLRERLLEDAPNRIVPMGPRQYLLLEATHRDLVLRNTSRSAEERPAPGCAHDRWDHQWRHIFFDSFGI
mmetsp:Transcript_136562/g.345815  ORF Transcript_136562/g.345815 Transcript_136562/m.345815 type:complete len:269 (+) Transcript_136562:1042-1848(+)